MKRSLCIVIFVLVMHGLPDSDVHADTAPQKRRVIHVCLLNDRAAQVDPRVILSITKEAFADFEKNFNISFVLLNPIIDYSGDVTAGPFDQGARLAKLCPQNAEIQVVFSNQKAGMENPYIDREDDGRAGGSSQYYGYIVLLDVSHRLMLQTTSGIPAPVLTLRHELGHLFDRDHADSTDSIMYTPSNKSSGMWSAGDRAWILSHGNKKWFRFSNKKRPWPFKIFNILFGIRHRGCFLLYAESCCFIRALFSHDHSSA